MSPSSEYALRIQLRPETAKTLHKFLPKGVLKNGTCISLDDLKSLSERSPKELGRPLHEILNESEVLLPKPVETPRNPELEARITRLKAQQEAREYRKMTKNVDSVRIHHPEDTISYQIKQLNKQIIAIAQFVFSIAAGFLFGFHGIELLVGSLEFGFRLLLGVICALIIALAELYFLAKKLAYEDAPLEEPSSPKFKND